MSFSTAASARDNNPSLNWSYSGLQEPFSRFLPSEPCQTKARHSPNLSDLSVHKSSNWVWLTAPTIPAFLHAKGIRTGQSSQLTAICGSFLLYELNHVHLNNYIKNIFYTMAISIKTCKEFISFFLLWLLKSAICQYYEYFRRWNFTCKENQWHIVTWVMMWQSTN